VKYDAVLLLFPPLPFALLPPALTPSLFFYSNAATAILRRKMTGLHVCFPCHCIAMYNFFPMVPGHVIFMHSMRNSSSSYYSVGIKEPLCMYGGHFVRISSKLGCLLRRTLPFPLSSVLLHLFFVPLPAFAVAVSCLFSPSFSSCMWFTALPLFSDPTDTPSWRPVLSTARCTTGSTGPGQKKGLGPPRWRDVHGTQICLFPSPKR